MLLRLIARLQLRNLPFLQVPYRLLEASIYPAIYIPMQALAGHMDMSLRDAQIPTMILNALMVLNLVVDLSIGEIRRRRDDLVHSRTRAIMTISIYHMGREIWARRARLRHLNRVHHQVLRPQTSRNLIVSTIIGISKGKCGVEEASEES